MLNKLCLIKNNKTLLNGALFSIFSFINKGFGFLLLLILANYIAPAEYGYLNLYNTVVMVVGYFIAMSSEGYLCVSYFREGEVGIKNTFSCILGTTVITTLLFCAILFVGGYVLADALNLPLASLYLAVSISFLTVYTHVNLDLFRLREKVGIYGVFSCGNALLNFILSILLVKTLLMGWEGRVYAQMICYTVFGVIGLLYFLKENYISLPNKEHWKKMLLWSIPLIPHLATNFIRQGCDRYIINYYHTIEDVGLFSFALNLANIIVMVGMGFNQSNSVDIYKVLGDKSMDVELKKNHLGKQRKMVGIVYILLSVLIVALFMILTPFLVPKYSSCTRYLPLLGVYGLLNCGYFLYSNYLFFFGKTKMIMYTTFISSIVHLVMSLLFTQYSLMFTCLIYCITQGVILYMIVYLAKKELNQQLSY